MGNPPKNSFGKKILITIIMKIRRIKLKRHRKRRANLEPKRIRTTKCVLIGEDIVKSMTSLSQGSTNEIILEIGYSKFFFWKAENSLKKTNPFLKQYLLYHDFEIILFFIKPNEIEERIIELSSIMNLCINPYAQKVGVVLDVHPVGTRVFSELEQFILESIKQRDAITVLCNNLEEIKMYLSRISNPNTSNNIEEEEHENNDIYEAEILEDEPESDVESQEESHVADSDNSEDIEDEIKDQIAV